MEPVSGPASDCGSSRSPCHSFSVVSGSQPPSPSRRRTPQPRQQPRWRSTISRSLYRGLSILILILCLVPVSALVPPAAIASDPTVDVARPASSSGEISVDDLPGLSSSSTPPTDEELRPRLTDAEGSRVRERQRRGANATADASAPMPRPFDSLASNFASTSCTSFFSSFLSNSTVTGCHAISLLLENSVSFFHTLSSGAAVSHVLDTSCSAPVSTCAAIMTSLAAEMLRDENCGPDFRQNNSVVQDAYWDLVAYEPLYRATCLSNPATQGYCFVDAVTNTSAPDDYNVYFLPLGSALGSAAAPTCNQCLQATMGLFAHWATIDNQPLDTAYLPSAKVINQRCGANFATTNLTVGSNTVTARAGLTVPRPDIRLGGSVLGLVLGAVLMGLF